MICEHSLLGDNLPVLLIITVYQVLHNTSRFEQFYHGPVFVQVRQRRNPPIRINLEEGVFLLLSLAYIYPGDFVLQTMELAISKPASSKISFLSPKLFEQDADFDASWCSGSIKND